MSATRVPIAAADWLSAHLLNSIGSIRPDERRDVAGAFVTLLGFMAGHALLETARDALFLATIPASQLPWVYLTIAVVALLLAQRRFSVPERVAGWHELTIWLVLAGIVTLIFWLLIPVADNWIYYALYTWSGVLATLVVVRFWTVLGNRFTVTQAKRLFAVIGTGSVAGAIAGSAFARLMTGLLPARHVVLAAAAVFFVSALGPRMLRQEPTAPLADEKSGLDIARLGQFIWQRPYLRRVAVLILVATITVTFVDFVFKLKVSRVVSDDELGAFFSSVYLSLNVLSLVVQVFFVSWLFRRVGVNWALAVVPMLLLLGATGFVIGGSLLLVLVLKAADGTLRHSLNRTGTELLFVPLAVDVRGRAKAFVDVIGQRGGQALASLLILVTVSVTTREVVFGVGAALAAAVWLYLAIDLRRYYLDVFRETLADEITETRIRFPALDMVSLGTLVSTLNSTDDRKVIAAMDMLAAEGKVGVVPGLILYHPSSSVVIHALDVFTRSARDDCAPIAERLSAHSDPEVRAALLRFQSSVKPEELALKAALEDPSLAVRSTALVGLVAGGWLLPPEALKALDDASRSGTPEELIALGNAIRLQPSSVFDDVLLQLSQSNAPEVQREAVRAMRAVRSAGYAPRLMAMLQQRALREEVRKTLVSLGPNAFTRLVSALRDPAQPHGVKRHVPGAIAEFHSQQSADALLDHLQLETDGMVRFKILRALGKLRNSEPQLELDGKRLGQALHDTLAVALRFMRWRQALDRGAGEDVTRQTEVERALASLLKDKQWHAVERLFRLLNLQTNNEDFHRIYRGLQSVSRESQAGSRELLEHLVVPPVKKPLLDLIDDLFDPTGVSEANDEDTESAPSYESVLRELVNSPLESLSSFAACHIGELELSELLELVGRTKPLSESHAEVLRQVSGRLDEPGRGVTV